MSEAPLPIGEVKELELYPLSSNVIILLFCCSLAPEVNELDLDLPVIHNIVVVVLLFGYLED